MYGGVVSDGDPIAYDHRVEVALAVEHGAVLNIRARAHADGIYVAAKNRVHPHGRALTQNDVADKLSRDIDVATCGELGPMALIVADHGFRTSRGLGTLLQKV
jgi:predicted amidohydrolase